MPGAFSMGPVKVPELSSAGNVLCRIYDIENFDQMSPEKGNEAYSDTWLFILGDKMDVRSPSDLQY
jgi:hypothetical protein